jgi:hypothetical protein
VVTGQDAGTRSRTLCNGSYRAMTRTLGIAILCSLIASFAAAQTPSRPTTVCEIVAHPKRFAGRIVTVRAEVIAGFEVFAIEDPSGKCDRMWLQYAGGGPSAMLSLPQQTPKTESAELELRRDAEFEKFDTLLNAEMYPRERGTFCMSCKRYVVTVTMTGRVDVSPEGAGFGHLNAYAFQFELQSVSDAVGKDIAGRLDSSLFSATPVRFPTGYFRGIVRSPSGEPVKGIEVAATRTDEVPLYMHRVAMHTDENGWFQLDVPPGTYIVGINTDVPVIASQPYPPTYFPGTTERTSATALTVQDWQTITTDLTIPVLAIRKDINIHVQWPDGRPAASALVWLRETRIAHKIAGNGLVTQTDENGSVTLPAFSGFAYTAHADTNVLHPSSYEHFCAQPFRIDQPEATSEIVLNLNIKGENECRDLNR